MTTSMTLVVFLPLMMTLMIWSVFILASSPVTSLVSLLGTSLILPMLFMSHMKLFWPCGLFLILMSTGLIVIFAYIVSLHISGDKVPKQVLWILGLFLTISLTLMNLNSNLSLMKITSFSTSKVYSVSLALSMALILLLLFLVVNFIRIVYSKGGGFRKKF